MRLPNCLTAKDLSGENQEIKKRDRPTGPSAYDADNGNTRIRPLTEFSLMKLPLRFHWRLMIVCGVFLITTYVIGLPGSTMPARPVLLLSLPAIPLLFLGAAIAGPLGNPTGVGILLSLLVLPSLFLGISEWLRRNNYLLAAAGAIAGIINGLLIRWLLYIAHVYST